jgi:hypothetical protein
VLAGGGVHLADRVAAGRWCEAGAIIQAARQGVGGGEAQRLAERVGAGVAASQRKRVAAGHAEIAAGGTQARQGVVEQHVGKPERAIIEFERAEFAFVLSGVPRRRRRQVKCAHARQRALRGKGCQLGQVVVGKTHFRLVGLGDKWAAEASAPETVASRVASFRSAPGK